MGFAADAQDRQNLSLQSFHGSALFFRLMVVSQQVKHAMRHQKSHFTAKAMAIRLGLRLRPFS